MEQIWNLKTILKDRVARGKKYVAVFVDFRKAYDSVDRTTLFNILREMGTDNKTLQLIKETLTNTYSKVKFMGEISEPFEIKTGVRQGDCLSPLLFNCVLDKVIKEWEKELAEKGIKDQVRIGYKKENITINCLAFADDLVLLSENIESAIIQVNTLKEIAVKTGLQISFEKTHFMTNIK